MEKELPAKKMSEVDKGSIIAFDVDDVLASYQIQLNRFHNKTFGTNFKFQDYHSFNLWEVWGSSYLKVY